MKWGLGLLGVASVAVATGYVVHTADGGRVQASTGASLEASRLTNSSALTSNWSWNAPVSVEEAKQQLYQELESLQQQLGWQGWQQWLPASISGWQQTAPTGNSQSSTASEQPSLGTSGQTSIPEGQSSSPSTSPWRTTAPWGQSRPAQQSNSSNPGYTVQTQNVSLPQNTQASENWAGYIDTPAGSSSYTSVTGAWKIPKVSGSTGSLAAQWIGLGGVSSNDLLQLGTIEEIDGGQTVANVFWEKLPDNANNIMTVPIGSTIHAKIAKSSASKWMVTFTATTPSGSTLKKTVSVTLSSSYATGVGTSAEWISEDPSDANNNLYPLADSGTVNYTNASVDGTAMAAHTNQVTPIALVDNYGNVLIAPSKVGSNGESFSTQMLNAEPVTAAMGARSYWQSNGNQVVAYGGWGHHWR